MVVSGVGLLRTMGYQRGRLQSLSGAERAAYRIAALFPVLIFGVIGLVLLVAFGAVDTWGDRKGRTEKT